MQQQRYKGQKAFLIKKSVFIIFGFDFFDIRIYNLNTRAGCRHTICTDKDWSNGNLIGFKGYFDARYAVAEIGMNVLVGKPKMTRKETWSGGTDSSIDFDIKANFLHMGIFGKYPFSVTEKIKVFPLLGFDFDIPLSVKVADNYVAENYDIKKELNRVWLDVGAGADFFVTDNLYVRPQALFGIKLNLTEGEKELKKLAKDQDTKFLNFGYKFNIGVGVGYKF